MIHEQLNRLLPGSRQEAAEENIAAVLASQSKLLEEIREGQEEARSWRSRLRDMLISGIIGALLGVALSAIFL
jgi:hypothetical protein